MKNYFRSLGIFISLSLLLVFTGCISIEVKKAEVEKVKKVAIVSVFSNYGIVSLDTNKGTASMFADMARKNAAKESGGKGPDEVTGQQLLGQGQNEFIAKFRSLGWQIQPVSVSMANPKYKEIQSWFIDRYNTKGYGQYVWIKDDIQTYANSAVMVNAESEADIKGKLAELCNALGADSVVILSFQFGYYSTFSIGGIAGRGKASIYSSLQMIDKHGNIIIEGYPARQGIHKGDSSKTVGMVAGIMPFSEDTKPMFDEALQNSIKNLLEHVNAELNKDSKKK